MLKYISYISQQSHVLKDEDMQALLAVSRKNNTANNFTGLLISYLGNFIQYIEGEPGKIDELYSRIKKDPRHHTVTELDSDYITERQFSDWSMAFRKIDETEAEELLGYKSFKKEEVFTVNEDNMKHPAMELLNSFVNSL